jgi:cell division control protein 45
MKHVILINCGASLDLVDILQPPEDAVFYLIDSLRPIEVHNVYNGVQVKIIVQSSELNAENASVPDFEDIFEENENTESVCNNFRCLFLNKN